MNDTMTVGLIGLGKLGSAIGRLTAEAGQRILVADRPDDPVFGLVLESVLPDARAVPLAELLQEADVVVLAVPQPALAGLDLTAARGVVVDATNAWEYTDGPDSEHRTDADVWAARAPGVRVVKSLNHAAYAELLADAREHGAAGRRALAVVGSDDDAVARASAYVDSLGFDPVPGPSAAASLLEPDGPVFGVRLDADGMRAALPEGLEADSAR